MLFCFVLVFFLLSSETRAGSCVIHVGYSTLFSPAGVLSSFLLLHREREREGKEIEREMERGGGATRHKNSDQVLLN